MLQAVEKRKTKLTDQRYGYWREEGAYRRTQEDEITSIIFGPLEFLDNASRVAILNELLGVKFDQNKEISIAFWPRIGDVEPDLLVTQCNEKNPYTHCCIVEIKWHSPLKKTQIQRQTKAITEAYNPEKTEHVLITKNLNYSGKEKTKHRDWMKLKGILSQLSGNTSLGNQARKYCQLASNFLESCGVKEFCGFRSVLEQYPAIENYNLPIFYAGWTGWSVMESNCDCSEIPDSFPLYWGLNKGEVA